jgi:hypothetical protein
MRHFINGIEISPDNKSEIGLVADFTGAPNVLALSVDTIRFSNDAKRLIEEHIANYGVFEGIPYGVQLSNGQTLNCYIDLLDGLTMRNHSIEAKVKLRSGKDNFNERAAGTSFELMLNKGASFQLTNIPYYIVPDNQAELGAMLLLSIYIMIEQTVNAAKELADSIADVTRASTPSLVVIPGVPLPVPVFNIGDIIAASLKAVAKAIYFALLLIALIDMATKMFVLIFPPERILKGVKVRELLTTCCAFLGYQFQSSLLDNAPGYTILPVPLIRDRRSIFDFLPDELETPFNKGVPSSSDTVSTIGALFDSLEVMFNAEKRISNGVVRFERSDWWETAANVGLEAACVLQTDGEDEWTYNDEEIWKRYYIHYQNDFADIHTLDKLYDYHDAEFSCEPLNITNPDIDSIKGLNDVAVNFALGARKERLNAVEQTAKQMLQIVDALGSLFGGNPHFAQQIGNRVNSLMVSQNYFGVTKMLYTVAGRQQVDYLDKVSAKALWNNYHHINQIQENAWEIRTNTRVRITSEQFTQIQTNNWCEIDGFLCEVLRIQWIEETHFCQITYRKPSNFAVNKVKTITVNE